MGDAPDLGFAGRERLSAGVDRVVAEEEIVLVRSSRAENKFAIGERFEFDSFARSLESGEIRSLWAGKMGMGTSDVGGLVASLDIARCQIRICANSGQA